MPYITINIKPKTHQLSFDDLWSNDFTIQNSKDTKDTKTMWVNENSNSYINLLGKIDLYSMKRAIVEFNNRYENLRKRDRATLYNSFKIPKRTGGYRQIDAPVPELSEALYNLKYLFEQKLYANHHTIAFAYCTGRCTYDAVARHQANDSKWLLKMDLHGFFPSTNIDFVVNQLRLIFPFSELLQMEDGEEEIRKMLDLCFLNGGLPQGTPISPLLTNLMMIPIDVKLVEYCREHSPILVVTRYADDIHISSKYNFRWTEVQNAVIKIFEEAHAPFTLNKEKTHYGSRSGRNWMLGLMYNQDGNITIGHSKKKQLKAGVFNFMADLKNNVHWSLEDLQTLLGNISYAKMIEKEATQTMLNGYREKFGTKPVEDLIKMELKRHTA